MKATLDELDAANPKDGEFRILAAKGSQLQFVASSAVKPGPEAGGGKVYEPEQHLQATIRECLDGKKTCVTPLYTDKEGRWISAFAPILDEAGAVAGVLSADREAVEYRQAVQQTLVRTAYYLVVTLAGSAGLGIFVSRRVTKPLKDLYRASIAARGGNFLRIEPTGSDEVAELTRDFNETNETLKRKMDELERLTRELEQRVASRTEQLSKSYEDLRDRQQVIQREMTVARRVQETITPKNLHREKIDVEVGYVPILEIGGDLGLVVEQGAERYDVAVGDVTGHGIGAALVVNRMHTLLGEMYRTNSPLDSLFHRMDYYLAQEIADIGIFMTLFACRIDLAAMEMEYGGAGHPPALLYRPGEDSLARLDSRCGILGVGELFSDDPPVLKAKVKSGDFVVFYTDGLVEATNSEGEQFGQERLEKTVRGAARDTGDGANLAKSLIEATKNFTGGYFQDDVLVVVAAIK
jgi:serine phosphatase RsbU (regulator of sigma subunit)